MKFIYFPLLVLFILTTFLSSSILCDTPANCTYGDITGTWVFSESARIGTNQEHCTGSETAVSTLRVDLLFPNVAIDQFGNKGIWTLIYNQGFEVTINYRKYFAFSAYKQKGSNVTSFCHRTMPGWSHDVLEHNWACWEGKKVGGAIEKTGMTRMGLIGGDQGVFQQEDMWIERINNAQSSWRAEKYEMFEGKTMAHILRLKGGRKSKIVSPPFTAQPNKLIKQQANQLPDSFDWRNVNGESFVSPVRNQGSCGSCYAFSSVGMIEARLRVLTNNTNQVILSPQDIVSCSEYSQGCEGGFPYLIAGKYGQDFGLVGETCLPYNGTDSKCPKQTMLNAKCQQRWYTANYQYVGGFYGGCNEELMRIQLVKNGPMSVSFEVYDDFMTYKSGIYHHSGVHRSVNGVEKRFDPFDLTNHAVLLVGYGVDQSGHKYWIVKNSWGEQWGEQGYFRIRRGTNECAIESIAVEAFPIP